MVCNCGAPFVRHSETEQTTVGYFRPVYAPSCDNQNHDDNCSKRTYTCALGHETVVSKRSRCSCGWVGKPVCPCHVGDKVDEWPEIAPVGSVLC